MEIILNHVTKRFGPTTVIDDVSITLNSGQVYGFQGINGAGKTMLMRLISGLIFPSSGTVQINHQVLHKDIAFPNRMGLLIESPCFINQYTGFENLKFLASIQGDTSDDEIETAMKQMDLNPADKRKYRKYSLGMRQRLGIVCAYMENPDLIILDEPMNSLDEDGIERVCQVIQDKKEKGNLIILSCHDTETLNKLADTVFVLVAGKIVETRNLR